MKNITSDFLIIGGGVIGVSIARALRTALPMSKVIILEKDSKLGMHQSTTNSGVIHDAIYYDKEEVKKKFCMQGNKLLTQYCKDNKLPLLQCGKLVVARTASEHRRLHDFYRIAQKNGASVELLSEAQARSMEPHLAKGLLYPVLFSPNTSSGDNFAVIRQLESDARNVNVDIKRNEGYKKIIELSDDGVTVETNKNNFISASKLINCAGAYADKVAQDFGEGEDFNLLPIKGHYFRDKFSAKELNIRSLVYPVPASTSGYAFLGLNSVRYPGDVYKIGADGIPAFWREHLDGFNNFNASEFYNIMSCYIRASFSAPGRKFLKEMIKQCNNYDVKHVVKEARGLVDIYDDVDKKWKERLTRQNPGIQAQLYNTKTYEFVEDFEIIDKPSHLHMLNIGSPGWTSALAIGDHVVDLVQKSQRSKRVVSSNVAFNV